MSKGKIFGIASVILLLVGGTYFYISKKNESAPIYRTIKVTKGNLTEWVQSTGTVSPQNRLEITPSVAGRIDEVLVSEGEEVKRGKILAWVSSNERAALLDAVRTQGEKEIKKWENLYRPTPVIAPIDGTIISRKVEAGQSFTNVDPIFVMADRLTVKANVDETDIALLKLNQEAVITLDAYPDHQIAGKVVHLAYDATLLNNVTTYEVDILPLDPPHFMRSGMTSNVNVEVDKKENVIVLPISALVYENNKTFVFQENNKKQRLKEVQTGLEDGKQVEITSGLNVDDEILIKETELTSQKRTSGSPLMPGGRRGRR